MQHRAGRDPNDAPAERDPRATRPGRRLRDRLDLGLHSAARRAARQTKTRAGRREIDVGPYVLKLLREQWLARPHTAEGYLFPSPEGAPFDGAPAATPRVIAEQMGHSDGGTLILRRYGHLYKGARQPAALALEAHVFGTPRRAEEGSEQLGPDLT